MTPDCPVTPAQIRNAWSSLPVAGTPDVLVIGGGPAGVGAAIAAARAGARTLIVERFGFLGGSATAALVPAFCPFTDRREPICRGIALEVLEEMKASMPHLAADNHDWVPIDVEGLKLIYDRRVTAAGAEPLFLTHFVDVQRDDAGRVTAVILHNKSGLQRYAPGVVVDCTGDGDVAAAAGADFDQGDPRTGEVQPCTMCFVLAGVDNKRLQPWLWADNARNLLLKPAIAAAKAAGDLDILEDAANVAYQSPTTISFNFSHVFDVDATRADQLSRAHVAGRELVQQLAAFVRKYLPGCENAYLVASGVQIGVRETRRIVGDHVLTLDDYLARRTFPDEIARNAYYIDIHLSKAEWEAQLGREIDWSEKIHQYEPGESHGVPYRCLTPRGLHNLLVAGRCISTDRPVQGSVRTMPNCLVMGEAAGCAAAWAARRHGGDVRAVDVAALRDALRGYGAYLPDGSPSSA
jgi:hypothetical protein